MKLMFSYFVISIALLSKIKTSIAGTCGGGFVGDGICSQEEMCCSQTGWCGTAHCTEKKNRLLRGAAEFKSEKIVTLVRI